MKHKLTPMYKYEHMRLVARQDLFFFKHSRSSDEALSVIWKHLQLRSKRCLLHMQNPGTKPKQAKHRTKHNQTKHKKHKHTQPTQQEAAHAVGKVKKVKRWDIRSALSSRTPARSHIDQLPLLSHHRSIYALATGEQRSCQPCPHQCPEHPEEDVLWGGKCPPWSAIGEHVSPWHPWVLAVQWGSQCWNPA